MLVETRQPSPAGIELGGKSMSVVFLENADGRDSTFNSAFANAFATNLEENYFEGEQGIDLYRITKDPKGDYACKDSLVSLVMTTGSDVVFLVDTPSSLGGGTNVSSKVYVYDSMSKDGDNVYMTQNAIQVSSLEDKSNAGVMGKAMSNHFVGKWKEESYPVIYYDWDEKWITAVLYAVEMDWKSASDIWLKFAQSGSAVKRACAEYNLALSCFMSEEYELALEWLDRCDKDYVISITDDLRKRIKAKMAD